MALPKKGSRAIIVNDIKYRWIGFVLQHDSPNEPAYVIIELYENPKQKIRAFFSWEKMNMEYKKIGHRLSKYLDATPPYIVRQTILYALKNGWNPNKGSGILELGNLDDKIDYTELKIHE